MAPTRSEASVQAAVPRLSASLVVVNHRNEVLMVHRNPKTGTFAGTHVFPGGNHDPKQDSDLRMTAIRETFEETGLLLASSSDPSRTWLDDTKLQQARDDINAQKMRFPDFLAEHGMSADVNSLMPFTQWITPPTVPRRFETQFFVAFLQDAPSTGFTAGAKQDHLPTPDGGREVVAARFVHPLTALQEHKANKISLMPPQFYILTTLSEILQGDTNESAQRHRVRALSDGDFGNMVINPVALPEKDDEGRTILTYEHDEARGGPKGRRHRALVRFGKGGVTTEVALQRNFDISSNFKSKL